MRDKKFLLLLAGVGLVTALLLTGLTSVVLSSAGVPTSSSVIVKKTSQSISATGSIHSQNEVTLHFLSSGRLTYVPFKQGDLVQQGQTIAQLDPYPLQEQLTAALNTYRSTRNTFDQTVDNSQNGVLFGAQRYSIEVPNKSGIGTGDTENNIINDMIKRIVDQNQANLDNSVIAVQLSQYALQLATLTAPFTGVVTQEDSTVPNVNVTPNTSFSISDPYTKVFRADVRASDIDFISIGAKATIHLDGQKESFQGTVIKIYPQKQILSTGEDVYQVDISSDTFNAVGAFGQNGSILIESNSSVASLLVPNWTIIGHNSIWVLSGRNVVLRSVSVGESHDNMIEILGGISTDDKIITDPKTIVSKKYPLL